MPAPVLLSAGGGPGLAGATAPAEQPDPAAGAPLPPAGAALALQPLQIVLQQGLGNLAHVIPTVLGEALQAAEASGTGEPAAGPPGTFSGGGHGGRSGPAAGGGGGDTLPWRDLRRLLQHLARLFGRPSQHRTLPPAHMPGGEFYTYLSVLIGAVNQIGAALSDVQAALADGSGPQPRQRLQLAMAMIAAARALRGTATAMQTGFVEGGLAAQAAAAAAAAAAPLAAGSGPQGGFGAEEAGTVAAEAAPRPLPEHVSSESGEEALGGRSEEEPPEPPEMAPPPEPGEDGGGGFGGSSASRAGADGPAAPPPSGPEAEQVMRVLPQLLGQLAQPLGAGNGVNDGLASIPPEVFNCWNELTQTEPFLRYTAQAAQPPLGEAHLAGDAAGSQYSMPLPPRDERAEGLQRQQEQEDRQQLLPEPPQHLDRAYLSALAQDLGRFAMDSAADASVPEAQRRYPHLARLAAHFAPRTGASPSSPGAVPSEGAAAAMASTAASGAGPAPTPPVCNDSGQGQVQPAAAAPAPVAVGASVAAEEAREGWPP